LAAASAQVSSPVALDPEPEPELCKMLMLLLLLLLLACSPWRAAAAPAQYEVTQLPGTGPLRTRMWSGFSAPGVAAPNGNGEVVFHYVVVEADVPHPETAATLVWYNGGPGQSGLFGLFVEIGPLLLNLDSQIGDEYLATGVPQLQPNPHSWNKVANIVVVNSPAPTGFSYCTGAGGDAHPAGKLLLKRRQRGRPQLSTLPERCDTLSRQRGEHLAFL
jgi:hypothetical protein